jgi:galactokinase
VLGAAIDRGVWVALAPRADRQWNFASVQKDGIVRVAADDFTKRTGADSWVNYPLGVVEALRAFGLGAPAGFDYLAGSDLPLGAGLSSSAAIELSSALAFSRAVGPEPARELLVKASRHAENHFVGVPCGILDQGVSGFGRKNHLVFIDCRGPRFETVPLPAGAHFWIFNTHTKHALVDGLYAARHRECMEAARALGVSLLVDAPPGALEAAQGQVGPVAEKRARHIIGEIARVAASVAALRAGDLATVGRLLTASHRSSQTLFENSTPELDFLVDTLTAAPHVHGARLTGGGFGGAVMAMTSEAFTAADAARVATAYERKFGAPPDILHTLTADGAQIL